MFYATNTNELRNETVAVWTRGYIGGAVAESLTLSLDAGMSSSNAKLVHVSVRACSCSYPHFFPLLGHDGESGEKRGGWMIALC